MTVLRDRPPAAALGRIRKSQNATQRGYPGLFDYLVGAHRPGSSTTCAIPATNVKPRDEFAGLHRFAIYRGLTTSRHRDAYRRVVTGRSSGATRVTPQIVCSDSPARVNPQTSCRGGSLPVRLRYTRKTGRAQQRSSNAAAESSVVSLRIHPDPNHRSAFS
jgi:hypothetical protein